MRCRTWSLTRWRLKRSRRLTVKASFTNLALAGSSLGTKYLNQLFVVEREVRDPATGAIVTPANYGDVGWLLIGAAAIGFLAPLIAILLVQASPLKTRQ